MKITKNSKKSKEKTIKSDKSVVKAVTEVQPNKKIEPQNIKFSDKDTEVIADIIKNILKSEEK